MDHLQLPLSCKLPQLQAIPATVRASQQSYVTSWLVIVIYLWLSNKQFGIISLSILRGASGPDQGPPLVAVLGQPLQKEEVTSLSVTAAPVLTTILLVRMPTSWEVPSPPYPQPSCSLPSLPVDTPLPPIQNMLTAMKAENSTQEWWFQPLVNL